MTTIQLIILTLLTFSHWEDHAFYVAVVEVERGDSQLTLSVKTFEDDLRDALRLYTGDIYEVLDNADANVLQKYFEEKVSISSCETDSISFVEISREGDSYWSKLTYPLHHECQTLDIEVTLLMEVFDIQKNILFYTEDGVKQFATLTKGKSSYRVR